MSEHKNQTTWKVSKILNGCVFIEDRDGNTVCEFYFQYGGELLKHPNAEENARRIVECVNGYDALQARVKELETAIIKMIKCKGLYHTEQNAIALARLVGIPLPQQTLDKCEHEAQRDELLNAMQSISEYWNKSPNDQAMIDALWHNIETANEAIAKIEAEKAG